MMRALSVSLIFLIFAAAGTSAAASETVGPANAECCKHEDLAADYGIIWTGSDPQMTIERLAASNTSMASFIRPCWNRTSARLLGRGMLQAERP